MRKLLVLALATATLALPAAALANKPTPKPKHVVSTAALVAKNSAWACKALRAQDATAFRLFGTNHNRSNAYGKCVSSHARLGHRHHPFTLTMRNVALNSTGTVSAIDANAACNQSASGCTLTSTGTVNGIVGGTYTSTWTILWTQATSNGAGGYCAPATGTTTVTIPALGALVKTERGAVCEVGATGSNVEHVLKDGTFTVDGTNTATTGLFKNATGSGTVAFDQKPGSSSALGGAVTGSETFETLTLTF
jgi:hypothetical protein